MTAIANVKVENQTCYLTGELDFSNAMAVYRQSLAVFKTDQIKVVDLSRLTSNSSAVVALMINWLKLNKSPLQFTNIPQGLASLIEAAGLNAIISQV